MSEQILLFCLPHPATPQIGCHFHENYIQCLKLKSNALQIATRTHARVRTDRPPCETTLRFGGERGHATSSYSYHFSRVTCRQTILILLLFLGDFLVTKSNSNSTTNFKVKHPHLTSNFNIN